MSNRKERAMKVIAFFNLKEDTDPVKFNTWVVQRQTKVFDAHFQKMKNFRVLRLMDSDNYNQLPQIVQLFDWEGTAHDWRDAMDYMRSTSDEELSTIVRQWRDFCVDASTQILYAEDISA